MINLYTDGASKGNPGPGGYGVILTYQKHRKELTAGFRLTTNNRMELMAVIAGLEALKGEGHQVTIWTDSKYVHDSVEKGWIWGWLKKGFKGKKNEDLWRRFIPLYNKHKLKFRWIKGHAGHPENERCDQLAVSSASGSKLLIDRYFEENREV